MISRVNIKKNSVKKNSVKSKDQTEKETVQRNTKERRGSRTPFICTCKQLLDHCTTVTHLTRKISFVISKPFFSLPKTSKTLFEAEGVVFIMNSNIRFLINTIF